MYASIRTRDKGGTVMVEPYAADDARKNDSKPGPWDDFFDAPRCPDFPDREQPPPEKREPL